MEIAGGWRMTNSVCPAFRGTRKCHFAAIQGEAEAAVGRWLGGYSG